MDANHFDAFTRAAARPRRAVAAGLLGLAMTPLMANAKGNKGKGKKKKKRKCPATGIPCGKSGCCDAGQQCVSGECQESIDPTSCDFMDCSVYTNPAQPGGQCGCGPTVGGANFCFAVMYCDMLTPCDEETDCSAGYACKKEACHGKSVCVLTCV
ncbi:MAG: hypothetical protein QM692_14395 [Thermomicrobiales bacterium]